MTSTKTSSKNCYTVLGFGAEVSLAKAAELGGTFLLNQGLPSALAHLSAFDLMKTCQDLAEEEEPVPVDKFPGLAPLLDLVAWLGEDSARREGIALTPHYGRLGWVGGIFFALQERQILIENERETGFVSLEEAAAPEEEIFRFRLWAGRVLGVPVRLGVFCYQE